ncbi:phosphate ABC transporter permease subunit PstC [Syntrophorhabdus aromaticivorans]|uniref:Phosphate transport system permease protein n=1 Tax=Syntrophorhabdus aromaticivorans TaxID=328301 RepID=A0A351U2S0_9BACT|nr:phosphate ABC transporter permease subunit PstC [Syntrophorhabdus aromaticivorans]NLW35063.1 phosphate ABC transporter permease subunit PstC [Syntrophorhabdus aromaticivorans]HBA54251.1 phosphate ABC transporter permease subunit PstC [Syntrophorhabdus aromaticivorans]
MRSIKEMIVERALLLSTIISGSITVIIFGFMFYMAIPILKGGKIFRIITGSWSPGDGAYGILPMIVSTLAISFLSVVISFPVSIGCSSFIAVLGPRQLKRFLKNVVQVMTGIPTVIYGFVGIFLLVPMVRELAGGGSGMSVITAALMLAVLISPTMILFFNDSFERVPPSYLDAADGLGAGKVQKLIYVVLPNAGNGIVIGLILAFGRALGDTLVALMIAGNSTQIPGSIFDSARALTAHIALVIAADYESLEFKSIFACGMVLYLFATVIVISARYFAFGGRRTH